MARRSRIALGVVSMAGAGALAWGGVAYAASEGDSGTPRYEIVTDKPADSPLANHHDGDCPDGAESGPADGGAGDGL